LASDFLSTLFNAEVGVTGATGLTVGTMHVCSGTSGDYTVGLPAVASNTGKFIGVRMSAALTKLVTLDANASELIDGALTRIMWANEVAILYCDGSTWTKVGGKSIAMSSGLKMGADQLLSVSTWATVAFDGQKFLSAPAAMVSTPTHAIVILRPGNYSIKAACAFRANNASACNKFFVIGSSVTNGNIVRSVLYSAANTHTILMALCDIALVAGESVSASVYYDAGSSSPALWGDTSLGASENYLNVTEVLTW
jgi:hypothetical protein